MSQIPIWIINLPQSSDRWDSISTQLDNLSLSYEKREACYGKNLTENEKRKICPTMMLNIKKRRPFDGEIGCYVSHFRCFEEIVEKKLDRVCILEDDAILDADFAKWVRLDTPMPSGCDILKLGGFTNRGSEDNFIIQNHNSRNLVFIKNLNSMTIGYVITLRGARKALRKISKMRVPIDLALFEYWNSGLCTLNVMPFPVKYPVDIETTITKNYETQGSRNVHIWDHLQQRMVKIKNTITKDFNRHLYPILWFGASAFNRSVPLKELTE